MNNPRCLNLASKLFVSISLFISILSFTACENFLQGEDVKEEITKTIEYNNAPSYTINVEALKGTGTIKTPATGEVEKKVTDVFPVRFEPEDSCKFIRWEAVISELGEGESPSDYIQFENAESLETKVTFKKATASGSVIVIRPVCPPRLTYTFEQDGGIIYPKDTSIEFNFSQPLSSGCLAGTGEEIVNATAYVSIQELTGGVDVSTYFNPPEVNKKKIIFRADTSFGYLPLINNQRMISVRLPKEKIWYVNEDYTTPVRVYLDSDISKTFIVGPETSQKTVINYKVRQNGEENLGILKIDGDALDNKNHEYSVGQKITLRYQLPDNYSFIGWKFLDAEGNAFNEQDLKLSYLSEAEAENLQILEVTVDNYMEKVVTIIPEMYDPVKVKIVKGTVGIESFKVDKTTVSEEEKSFEYGVGKSFTLNCKMKDGFTFSRWKFMKGETEITPSDLNQSFSISDEDVSNGLAQVQVSINGYIDGVINVIPEFYYPIKIKLLREPEGIASYKVDSNTLTLDEQSFEYGVGRTFNLSCKILDGYSFFGWDYKKTYTNDKGEVITESVSKNALEELGIKISFDEETAATDGYDAGTRYLQSQITITKYTDNIISIKPITIQNLAVINFNNSDLETIYNRDRNIEFTFNHSLLENCKDKLQIKIVGVEDNKVSEYFEPIVLEDNKLSISAKITKLIPLLADGTNTITLVLPASDFMYEAQTSDGKKYNVGLISDLTYTYKINSETKEKTKIKVQLDSLNPYGSLKVDGVSRDNEVIGYSIGSTTLLTFNLSKEYASDYYFKNWKITYTPANAANENETITLDSDNLAENYKMTFSSGISSSTGELPVYGATIVINGAIDGVITIQPVLVYVEDVNVTISGSHGKFSPGKGLQKYKLRQSNHIEYEADSDYAFIRWQLVNSKTGQEFEKDEKDDSYYYIKSTSLNKPSLDFEIINIPEEDEDIEFELIPVIKERPQIISNSPLYSSEGVLRDTTIQVMFDYDMDENSIYYTKDELTELSKQGISDSALLPTTVGETTRYYGYKYTVENDGITKEYCNFKNITIINSATNENISGNFKAPVFESPRKLSIPIKESLTAGMNVMVTLEKDFFRLVEGTEVSMSQAKKWLYLVNGEVDNVKPELRSMSVIVDSGAEIEAVTSLAAITETNVKDLNFIKSGKIKLGLKVHDNTAPDSTFTLNLEKLYNGSYQSITSTKNSKPIDYSICYGQDAVYGNEVNNVVEPLPYELAKLDDGVYSLSFEAKDRSGNSLNIPESGKYYFSLDTKAPDISVPVVKDSNDNATSLILEWNKNNILDYKGTIIKYRKWQEGEYTSTDLITDTTYTISELIPGTHYEIIAEYYDYAGNRNSVPVNGGAYTRPATPTASLSSTYGSSLTVTGTKGSEGNFTDMRIRYSVDNGSNWTEYSNRITENTVSQTLVLPKGYNYLIEVCSYDKDSNKYSIPYYKTGTTLPAFITTPNAVNVSTDFNQYTNKGIISWTRGTGNYTGYFVYCSTDPAFPDTTATLKEKITSYTTLTKTFTDLTPGTYYYCKVEPYYIYENNKGTASSITTYTKCEAPKNLTCTTVSNTQIDLSWTKPAGDFKSYTLEYKKHSATSYTPIPLNSQSTNYPLTRLDGGDSYDIRLTTVGAQTGMNNSTEKKDVKTCPNPVRNFSAVKKTGSNTNYTVTWTAPASGNYDGYKLYISSSVSGLSSASPTTYSKTLENSGVVSDNLSTAANSLLYLKVETYLGSLKTETEPICCSLALDAVKNLSVVPDSTTSIKLSWTNLASTAYDGIRIYMDGTLKQTITSKSTTSYTQTGLSPNTKHNFTVTTYKNDSATSTEFTAEALGSTYTYSTPVTSMSVAANGPKSVKVSWTKPSNASEWTQLFIYRNDEYEDYWYPTHTATSSNYSVAAGGTEYTYKIVTLNAAGTAYEGGAITRTLTTPPEPVTNLSLSSNSQNYVTLSWSKPSGNYSGIRIYKKLHSEASYPTSAAVTVNNNTSTATTISGLTAGTSYDFKLETYLTGVSNVGETSQASITDVYTRPNAPTNFTLYSCSTNSLTYSWSKPSGNYTGLILHYKKSTDSAYTSVYPSKTATSYTISNLAPGTIYSAYLTSYHPNENSTYNIASTSYITKATPLEVSGSFTVANDGDGTKVSWAAPTNASSSSTTYYVYYKLSSSSSWSYKTTTNTYYKFGNTDLTNGKDYDFYVKAYNYINSEGLWSGSTSTKTCRTPPGALAFNSLPQIWTDDAMGTVTLHWVNTTGRSDIGGIYVYIGNTFLATVSYYNGSTVNQVVKIPNYYRGGSYTFKFVPYNGSSKGPEYTRSLTTSSGNLKINGDVYYYTALKNVITSTYKVYYNSSSDNNLPGKDVDSTNFEKNVGKSYAFWKNRNSVTMSPYSIGAYEVTQELYEAVMGGNSSKWKEDYKPVSNVSWYQAVAFCNKLSVMQGLTPCYKYGSYSNSDWLNVSHTSYPTSYQITYDFTANGYHLPTECQWELAGHGGTKEKAYDWNYKYPGSDGDRSIIAYAGGKGSYTTVGSLSSNSLGLYDMVGNVREWTSDWWSGTDKRTTGNLTDPAYSWYTSWASESLGVIAKGCDYNSKGTSEGSIDSKCWGLQALTPSTADNKTGFRICRNVTYK